MRRTRDRGPRAGRTRAIARCLWLALTGAVIICPGAIAAMPADGPPLQAAIQTAAPETLFARAEQALNRGQLEQAVELYQQVPAGSPLAGRALFGEGRCLAALGRIDPAIQLFRQVQEQPDTSAAGRLAATDATELLGRIYLELGRSDAARRAFHELARRSPERQDYATVMVAQSYRNDGAWFDAYAALKPALHDGLSEQAYTLALDLYWNLDAGAQRELSRLLQTHLARPNRELTDNHSE